MSHQQATADIPFCTEDLAQWAAMQCRCIDVELEFAPPIPRLVAKLGKRRHIIVAEPALHRGTA
jgi:hypothetical protein